jgi:hypothetical protein
MARSFLALAVLALGLTLLAGPLPCVRGDALSDAQARIAAAQKGAPHIAQLLAALPATRARCRCAWLRMCTAAARHSSDAHAMPACLAAFRDALLPMVSKARCDTLAAFLCRMPAAQ